MAENEFPLTAAQGAQAAPPAPAPAQPAAAQPAAGADNAETAVPDQNAKTETAENRAEKPVSRFKDFIKNGEILRRLIILVLLVLFIAGGIFGLISFNSSQEQPTMRTLGTYGPQEIGQVLDFLDLEGYTYSLAQGDTILVNNEDYSQIREQMLRRGIAVVQENLDEGDSILMTDSGFGVSQRMEGERIKHSREQQLARAIERIDGIEHATVLLAIPKENVFARKESRPSAAVVVTLQRGMYLSPENVNSIRFMVSSSVHNLLSKDVTVTDQNGRLLSAETGSSGSDDKLQQEFEMRTLREAQYRDKLDSILAPMLGYGNYSAEVDVTLDTTVEEETRQLYNPDSQAVRSETLREERGGEEQTNPYGVPGSLSNQPPANAVIPQQLRDGTATGTTGENKERESREAVRNYEVDTTIRHTTRPTNTVSRLTVSVAVDYVRQVSPEGVVSYAPRPQEDLDKIADLVRGGLGLDDNRGDFVHVETVAFPHDDVQPPLPWWQQESFYRIARVAGAVLVILMLVLFVIRPLVNRLLRGKTEEELALEHGDADSMPALEGNDDLNLIAQRNDMNDQIYSINREGGIELPNLHKNEDLIKAVRTLVSNEPQLSAEVVRDWINSDLGEKKKAG